MRSNTRAKFASQGVFNLREKDRNGTDRRAQVLVRIDNGKWMLAP